MPPALLACSTCNCLGSSASAAHTLLILRLQTTKEAVVAAKRSQQQQQQQQQRQQQESEYISTPSDAAPPPPLTLEEKRSEVHAARINDLMLSGLIDHTVLPSASAKSFGGVRAKAEASSSFLQTIICLFKSQTAICFFRHECICSHSDVAPAQAGSRGNQCANRLHATVAALG